MLNYIAIYSYRAALGKVSFYLEKAERRAAGAFEESIVRFHFCKLVAIFSTVTGFIKLVFSPNSGIMMYYCWE